MSEATVATATLERLIHDLPDTTRAGMRVPARVFADDVLWEDVRQEHALEQLCNVATLPGVVSRVCGMPDIHEGYGFPVGGVAATRVGDGVISPGGVGYDINCGVRLLTTGLTIDAISGKVPELVHALSRSIPTGGYGNTQLRLERRAMEQVLKEGSRSLVAMGLATPEDLAHTESGGALPGADPAAVSERAQERGRDQLGTMGSGNHFVEIERVEAVTDPAAARAFGLVVGGVAVLIHTGSRGLGHQVCTDYVHLMLGRLESWGIELPDRQLACAPLSKPEARRYLAAMNAAANFAFANRQAITAAVRDVFRTVLGPAVSIQVCYDVAHNMAKLERHGGQELCVHRKGATRAFGPSHPETPAAYRDVGQPVFIPGSMGTASWVLAGTDAALDLSFGTACHGAGRARSRGAARAAHTGRDVREALVRQGISVAGASARGLAEEAPDAYKDVERVVEVVHQAGLARKVARLRPIGVVKG